MRTKSKLSPAATGTVFLVLLLATACGSSSGKSTDAGSGLDGGSQTDAGNATNPTVLSLSPLDGANDVSVTAGITATFSEAIDPTTLTTTTFTLLQGPTQIAGQVSYESATNTALFTPAAPLGAALLYTATISTGVKSASGLNLATARSWSFTTLVANTAPAVSLTSPADAAVDVWTAQQPGATFNEPMDPATLTATTFTVTQGGNAIAGQVTYHPTTNTAIFSPTTPLGASLPYVATISTGTKSASGLNLPATYSWSFTTGAARAGALPVNLGTAGDYVVLAETQISTVPASAITGDIGISPAAATYITGFSLIADSTNTFSTSSQITGKVYAADYSVPTSSNLTTAITDMGIGFTDAAGRAPDTTELGAGDIGGLTLQPGVYQWGTGLLIPTNVQFAGNATDVWIFQIAQNLTVSNAAQISLSGGLLPKNVFWQVSGAVGLGTTAHFEGVVLSQTAISLATGASINGRLLAQSAVSLDTSTIVAPAP